ncbi:MAG: 2-dehydropantoate 2-reductase [Pseudomonadota bacterium]|nr:2-dehydropantoate 2-reductase [Pseudomonadota bacterium]
MTTAAPIPATRVLLLGCGGIGGTLAAHLTAAGANVCVVTRSAAVAEAVNRRGFRITGVGAPGAGHTIPGRVEVGIPAGAGPFDLAFLATQPTDLDVAARQAFAHLAPEGRLVTFPNGLPEERVARVVGDPTRVLGAIVGFGASHPEPGVFERTSKGGFAIGRLDGQPDPALLSLAALLAPIAPVHVSDNLRGARWSKLAINAAVSSLGTLGGDRLGVLLRRRHARRLALEIITEVVDVARREGVRLQPISGTIDLDWLALSDAERSGVSVSLLLKHAILMLVGFRYRRLRSSMLAALERGQVPPVAFLNGEVTARADAHGVAAPINRAVVARILELATGARRPAHAQLDALYADTRVGP